jgi:nucleotidyltransferase/DNA polymerase involved in DNA repair
VGDEETLKRTLRELSVSVSRHLQRAKLKGTTIKLKLRWADFTTLTRQMTVSQPTDQETVIYGAAAQLLEKVWSPGRLVRLIGVGVSGFDTSATYQLSLWDAPDSGQEGLQSTLDALCDRFGEGVVRRGSELQKRDRSDS